MTAFKHLFSGKYYLSGIFWSIEFVINSGFISWLILIHPLRWLREEINELDTRRIPKAAAPKLPLNSPWWPDCHDQLLFHMMPKGRGTCWGRRVLVVCGIHGLSCVESPSRPCSMVVEPRVVGVGGGAWQSDTSGLSSLGLKHYCYYIVLGKFLSKVCFFLVWVHVRRVVVCWVLLLALHEAPPLLLLCGMCCVVLCSCARPWHVLLRP